jgi:hypothetical protein
LSQGMPAVEKAGLVLFVFMVFPLKKNDWIDAGDAEKSPAWLRILGALKAARA